MKTSIKILLTISIILVFIVNSFSQRFNDSSLFYTIKTETKRGEFYMPEIYKLYLNNNNIKPYIYTTPDKKHKFEKGDDYTLIENENSIYIKYRVDGINYTEKIVSLNTKNTLSINEDTEFPMMIFCFGNKSVLDGIEKFYMFDQIVETYRIKFFVDEYNYTYMYIHIDELVPVKYEMYAHKKKDNSVKHKIVVQLEKASGQYINGLANMISLDKDATATAFVK